MRRLDSWQPVGLSGFDWQTDHGQPMSATQGMAIPCTFRTSRWDSTPWRYLPGGILLQPVVYFWILFSLGPSRLQNSISFVWPFENAEPCSLLFATEILWTALTVFHDNLSYGSRVLRVLWQWLAFTTSSTRLSCGVTVPAEKQLVRRFKVGNNSAARVVVSWKALSCWEWVRMGCWEKCKAMEPIFKPVSGSSVWEGACTRSVELWWVVRLNG